MELEVIKKIALPVVPDKRHFFVTSVFKTKTNKVSTSQSFQKFPLPKTSVNNNLDFFF